MNWYYIRQGQQFGPVDEEELSRLAQEGRISPDDLIWNSTLGGNWVPASSVEFLFTSQLSMPPPPPPPPKSPSPPPILPPIESFTVPSTPFKSSGVTHNRDLMRMARESLHTHWGLGVGVTILYLAIVVGISYIPHVGMIAEYILTGPLAVGLTLVFLTLARRSQAEVGQLFQGFQRFGTALGAYLLMLLFILLWTLLLIVPGIIASFSYAMTYFVIADDPTVGPLQAITRSKEMMRGNKWKLFCLGWRFFGWALLCILTLGIGFLWLAPYMNTTFAHFYDDVRP
ncbi:MAG: DUF975 family protein [bacterium]